MLCCFLKALHPWILWKLLRRVGPTPSFIWISFHVLNILVKCIYKAFGSDCSILRSLIAWAQEDLETKSKGDYRILPGSRSSPFLVVVLFMRRTDHCYTMWMRVWYSLPCKFGDVDPRKSEMLVDFPPSLSLFSFSTIGKKEWSYGPNPFLNFIWSLTKKKSKKWCKHN